MTLYHYYERATGPLRSLSDVSEAEAERISGALRAKGDVFAARRDADYMARRRVLEAQARALFLGKGGQAQRAVPHYFVVEACPWLQTWYRDGACIRIAADALDMSMVSFTYGDMFPTFSPRVQDGREYRGKVYTYAEILGLIERYGLPQHWNADGAHGPERYIEAQVWCEIPPRLYQAV